MHNNIKIFPLEIDRILKKHEEEQDWDFPYLQQISFPNLRYFCDFLEQLLADINKVICLCKDDARDFYKLNKKYEEYQHYNGSILHRHICAHICALETEVGNDNKKACSAGAICHDWLILSRVLTRMNSELQSDNDTAE